MDDSEAVFADSPGFFRKKKKKKNWQSRGPIFEGTNNFMTPGFIPSRHEVLCNRLWDISNRVSNLFSI